VDRSSGFHPDTLSLGEITGIGIHARGLATVPPAGSPFRLSGRRRSLNLSAARILFVFIRGIVEIQHLVLCSQFQLKCSRVRILAKANNSKA